MHMHGHFCFSQITGNIVISSNCRVQIWKSPICTVIFAPVTFNWKYCYKYLVTAILNFTNPICTVIFASLAPDCCHAQTN